MNDPSARRHRVFVGIELDAPARAGCARAAERLRQTGYAAKYGDAAGYHITLAFLGGVSDEQLEELLTALPRVSCRHQPFALQFDRLSAFPHERRPRVIFAGPREQGAPFRRLAHDTRETYAALGFVFEGDAVAHVSLARVRGGGKALPLVDIAPFACRVQALALFQSVFDRERNATRYELIATAPLSS